MKKQILFLLLILSSTQYIYAQAYPADSETWAQKPVIHTLPEKYSKESAVIIYDKRKVEYVDEAKDQMAEYYTIHKIIHINDDRGLESFNKIYLGVNENSDITAVKARSILPGGKIIELDKSNIKDLKESDGNVYKIFAMDGLEKGSEVEYFYTFKKSTSFFGREEIQSVFPVLEAIFQIVGPKRLKFETKTYNTTVASGDTVINSTRIAQCSFKDVAGVEEEKYADYAANLQRVEYKLSYNESNTSGERLFTWNELAKRVYSIYTDFTDKELKQAAAIVTENGWDKLADEESKVIAVEAYVKKNFSYNEDLTSDDGNALSGIFQNKIAGTVGTLRLYTAIFQSLGVKYQYVLTCNRANYIIDKQFENWNNTEYPLLYFPAENKFLAPTRPDYRYPWILPAWGDTNGLFCKNTSLGNFSTAIAEIKNIPLEDYSKSVQNIESKLELSASMDSLTIDEKQIYAGYPAVGYRDAFNFANEDQKRNMIKEITKSATSSENIISSDVQNKEFENLGSNTPLIIHTVTKSGELIERAGNKLLLKMGLAIGPQVEMYQEKPRQEPIDMDFAHVEERKIEFIIPEGYTISNPNDLKISETYQENGELEMGFVSDYEIKGNVLSVHIMEQYRKAVFPLSVFAQFRKVINASSDFNKVVLVLAKK